MTFKCARCLDAEVPDMDLGDTLPEILGEGIVCEPCRKTLPRALLKAIHDTFDYAAGLKSGLIIRFASASLHGEWVEFSDIISVLPRIHNEWTFERGIEVRLSDIEWIADAPQGS